MTDLPLAEETEIIQKSDATRPVTVTQVHRHGSEPIESLSNVIAHFQQDAPPCPNCGSLTVRSGACHKCLNCGESLGCS
ncbi:MAG: hypothetical protein M2R45_01249 [Verrucomicrobia subdivision 3 bacterium]|nr:hypothetical protein [Limisphaerales bacterium]MCS1415120.1 hypothetical protein [Limisphaerales bacterium]